MCPSPSPAPQPEDCRRSFTQQPRRTTGKAWHPDYLRPAADKTMSAEELGSEGRWFGDDYDRNGLFGNAPTQFGELREDFKPRSGEVDQQFHPYQDDGRRPPVTMETASTGKPDIYGIKVPVQVIPKSYSVWISFCQCFLPTKAQRAGEVHHAETQSSICRRFSVRTDGLPVNCAQTYVHQSKRNNATEQPTVNLKLNVLYCNMIII